ARHGATCAARPRSRWRRTARTIRRRPGAAGAGRRRPATRAPRPGPRRAARPAASRSRSPCLDETPRRRAGAPSFRAERHHHPGFRHRGPPPGSATHEPVARSGAARPQVAAQHPAPHGRPRDLLEPRGTERLDAAHRVLAPRDRGTRRVEDRVALDRGRATLAREVDGRAREVVREAEAPEPRAHDEARDRPHVGVVLVLGVARRPSGPGHGAAAQAPERGAWPDRDPPGGLAVEERHETARRRGVRVVAARLLVQEPRALLGRRRAPDPVAEHLALAPARRGVPAVAEHGREVVPRDLVRRAHDDGPGPAGVRRAGCRHGPTVRRRAGPRTGVGTSLRPYRGLMSDAPRPGEHPDEPHRPSTGSRLNRLRAGVLGANDGIVSTAGVVVGVAATSTSVPVIATAGGAALLAGALSMAAGEYVSVSTQRDTEKALLATERRGPAEMPDAELDELAGIYEAKGLTPDLARQVAVQLTERDPLAAHADAELHLDPDELTSPWEAALASVVSFTVGGLLP